MLVESESKASSGYITARLRQSSPKGVYRSSYPIYSKFIISNRACHWKEFFQLFGDASLLSPRENCLSVPKPSFMTVLLDDKLAAQLKKCLETGKTMGRLELPTLQLVTADWSGRKNVALIPKWRSNLGKRRLLKTGRSILMKEKRRL